MSSPSLDGSRNERDADDKSESTRQSDLQRSLYERNKGDYSTNIINDDGDGLTAAYDKVRVLGRGSFGLVHLVKHKETKRLFALKVCKYGETKEDQEISLQEVRMMQLLNHPCIIKLYGTYLSSDGKGICLIMSYCESGDLARAICSARDGRVGGKNSKKNRKPAGPQQFTESTVLKWFVQICLGMQHMHAKKVMHRDLKPSNFFLGEGGQLIRIGDFGLAKLLEKPNETAISEAGTPHYTSPEMISSHPYSFPTDIWSLGVILYELLALEMPFKSKNNDVAELVTEVVSKDQPALDENRSIEVRSLCARMLQKNPNCRPDIVQVLATPLMRKYIHSFLKGYNPMQIEHRERMNNMKDLKSQIEKLDQIPAVAIDTVHEILIAPDLDKRTSVCAIDPDKELQPSNSASNDAALNQNNTFNSAVISNAKGRFSSKPTASKKLWIIDPVTATQNARESQNINESSNILPSIDSNAPNIIKSKFGIPLKSDLTSMSSIGRVGSVATIINNKTQTNESSLKLSNVSAVRKSGMLSLRYSMGSEVSKLNLDIESLVASGVKSELSTRMPSTKMKSVTRK